MRQYWLYVGTLGFVGGVALRSLLPASETNVLGGPFVPALFFIVLSVAVGAYAAWACAHKRPHVFLVALCLCAAGLGVLRFDVRDRQYTSPALDAFVGEYVRAEGVVVDEPDERDTNSKLTVSLMSVGDKAYSGNVNVLLTTALLPTYRYGDRIRFSGVLQSPGAVVDEDGRVFDYAAYLESRGISYQLFYPTILLLGGGGGNVFVRTLFSLKASFLERISRVIPEPESALLGGLVVGAKRSLGSELQEDFRNTGIIHIVVLSGYNVTVVANAIVAFLSFLPRAAGLSFGALSIVLFAVMTGASATIVRASLMALIVIAATATHRTYAITNALLIAGFVMVLHNPDIVLFDSSFQLSFAATVGLIYVSPRIERFALWVPARLGLRSVVTATVATQLFVLPMILYKMGTFSFVAVPVNLLILVTVPLTMLVGFLAGALGFVSELLSLPFAYAAYALLAYQLAVVDFFARLPFAALSINTFPFFLVLIAYGIFAVLLVAIHKKQKKL